MNDQQQPQPYDPYYPPPQIIGYDEYGQPVYQQPQPQQHQQHSGYDTYASQQYGYDPYGQQQPQQPHDAQPGQAQGQAPGHAYGYDAPAPATPDAYASDPYATGSYDAGGYPTAGYAPEAPAAYDYDTGQQPAVDTTQQWSVPPQQAAPHQRPEAFEGAAPAESPLSVPGQRRAGDEGAEERDYRTEQFSFIEENGESEDVIDWLKFTESRSERREEARRRGRFRVIALAVVLALFAVGGVGYLWAAGKLPGLSDDGEKSSAGGPQKRDVIVVHLHNTKKKGTSTVLLVDNVTAGRGTTVLLPNALGVAGEDGAASTLGKSVEEDGSAGTREAVGALLGAKISGTWRLDTPFLENLVELVGSIDLTTDTEVPGEKKGAAPLVSKGENQTLNGRAAVAYATHLGPKESEAQQLQRFGQVMLGVLKKFPSDAQSATVTVETLAQILDPSLTEKDLGASLAKLADHAKGGDHTTTLLPVQPDGTLSEQASVDVVKNVLGGSVTAPEQGAAVRVGIRNATGEAAATEKARISLVNAGYAVVDGGKADTADASQVTYGDEGRKAEAAEIAKTLGLPAGAVKQGKAPPNADVSVVLGKDFRTG
ncbi:LytR C-terminal domain-containing protein [Streptomyces sp. NPDC047315]|uniref:LCP family protein n=1 Tax=Streptomyces sp. NPDC047315 TaxID=3155142 RepID=UPI0034038C5B